MLKRIPKTGPITPFKQSETEKIRQQEHITASYLRRIFRLTTGFPKCPPIDKTVEQYTEQRSMLRSSINNPPIRPAHLSDGIIIDFLYPVTLADHSYRLAMPFAPVTKYGKYLGKQILLSQVNVFRTSVDVDYQTVASQPLNLSGVDEIATRHDVILGLIFCQGALAVESAVEWPHRAKR